MAVVVATMAATVALVAVVKQTIVASIATDRERTVGRWNDALPWKQPFRTGGQSSWHSVRARRRAQNDQTMER
uniref:Putative secreted protein n=1 Tax=Anopheles darlingi TaxID=43151 RepID=A0A2M4DC79_ANODA